MRHGCKGYFPFATVTGGCKELNFMGLFNQFNIFCETFKEIVSKMPDFWQNPMKFTSLQPSVTVVKE